MAQTKKQSTSSRTQKTKQGQKSRKPAKTITQRRTTHSATTRFPKTYMLELYQRMLRSRQLLNLLEFQGAGREAVTSAVSDVFKTGRDWFFQGSKGLHLLVALEGNDAEIIRQGAGLGSDNSKDAYHNPKKRIVGDCGQAQSNEQLLSAVGAALACSIKNSREVIYSELDLADGIPDRISEALRWASRERLPLVVVAYQDYLEQKPAELICTKMLAKKLPLAAEGLAFEELDGSDYSSSFAALKRAYERAAKKKGPTLLVATVASLDSAQAPDEAKQQQRRCPLRRLERALVKHGAASRTTLRELSEQLEAKLSRTHSRITNSILKEVDEISEKSSLAGRPIFPEEHSFNTPPVHMSLDKAIEAVYEQNDNLILLQQHSPGKGSFSERKPRATKRFRRLAISTENLISAAVGVALTSSEVIVELTKEADALSAITLLSRRCDDLLSSAGNSFMLSLTVCSPQEENSPRSIVRIDSHNRVAPLIILPSSTSQAASTLSCSLHYEHPIVLLDPSQHTQSVGEALFQNELAKEPWPLLKAKVLKSGECATIVSWGTALALAYNAATAAQHMQSSVEVVGLLTVSPLDWETILASVKKTSRVLVVEDSGLASSLTAEIMAQIAQFCFEYLDAPPMCIETSGKSGFGEETVVEALRQLLNY